MSGSSRERHGSEGALGHIPAYELYGTVIGVSPLSAEIAGLSNYLAIGDRVLLDMRGRAAVAAEIVRVGRASVFAVPFQPIDGLGAGAMVRLPCRTGQSRPFSVAPSESWLGRVIDPLCEPMDGLGPLPSGAFARPVRAAPPPATQRARLGPPIDLGVRVLNCFTTCRTGQRLGLFAASGVGKSTLLSMMAQQAGCDVIVLALVGERGREVREFIEDDLGAAGLARSVVVIATSDTPPLMRREAAYTATAIAEHFRDQGLSVLLLMDSVTRFCLALREIALSAGEPPATRGYPPSVFAELPRLLERAGPGPMLAPADDGTPRAGQITALFTVLVEGDDHDEPVADAVRGILDGHVVLDRKIGEAGRYPAVDVLRSLSRAASGCLDPVQSALVRRARAILSLWADMADMVRLGAYKAGSDPAIDEAVRLAPRIEAMLAQGRTELTGLGESFALLAKAMEDG